MKWGVRRYQNPDGTLTSAGKKRYSNPDGTLNEKGKKRLDNQSYEDSRIMNAVGKAYKNYRHSQTEEEFSEFMKKEIPGISDKVVKAAYKALEHEEDNYRDFLDSRDGKASSIFNKKELDDVGKDHELDYLMFLELNEHNRSKLIGKEDSDEYNAEFEKFRKDPHNYEIPASQKKQFDNDFTEAEKDKIRQETNPLSTKDLLSPETASRNIGYAIKDATNPDAWKQGMDAYKKFLENPDKPMEIPDYLKKYYKR